MTSESVQVLKQKEASKSMNSRDFLFGRGKLTQNGDDGKSVKKLKSLKEFQECKKSFKDSRFENIFLNSEFFKRQSNNVPPLSFCSGDKCEYRWTVGPNLEISSQQKASKIHPSSGDVIKGLTSSNSEIKEKDSNKRHLHNEKSKPQTKELLDEKPEKCLESILSGNENIDKDLITLITEQMFLAEKELQITRLHLTETMSKLNEKNMEIIGLHEKVKNLQNSKKFNSENDNQALSNKLIEDYQKLILASEKLKKQVKDMEEFLNDYGLVWIGDRESDSKPDFDKIIKNFQRLNSIASQPKIIQTTLGAKFELPREIPVVLYSNGILLRENDFREYNKLGCSLFLQDIEDGYFPSELQSDYPDGVPFEVTDKRNEIYTEKSNAFNGIGKRLGSVFDDKPPSVVFLKSVKESKSQGSSSNSSLEFSAKKNPKKIVKTIQERVKNCHPHQKECEWEKDSLDSLITDHKDFGKLLTLKIRFGKNKTELFTLEMNENDRLSVFYDCLRHKLCERYHNECLINLKSNYTQTDFEVHVYGKNPFRLLDNLYKRLKDFGISHNCVINVWEI